MDKEAGACCLSYSSVCLSKYIPYKIPHKHFTCGVSSFMKLFWSLLPHTDASVGKQQLCKNERTGVYYKITVSANDQWKETCTTPSSLFLTSGNTLIWDVHGAVIELCSSDNIVELLSTLQALAAFSSSKS